MELHANFKGSIAREKRAKCQQCTVSHMIFLLTHHPAKNWVGHPQIIEQFMPSAKSQMALNFQKMICDCHV
jgi:hypothetical protein